MTDARPSVPISRPSAGAASSVADLAAAITTAEPAVRMRIGVVIDVQDALGRKVKTDQTGDAWISRSEDTTLTIGDRVWMIQQGSVFVVAGRLSGEPAAVPIGAIMPFAGSTPPAGWLRCDGQAISRTTYSQLYALTGLGYGVGDGSTTFNVPNLRGRFPLGSADNHFQTTTGGVETVTLSASQVPAHDHGAVGNHTHVGTVNFGGDFGTSGSGSTIILSTTNPSNAPFTSAAGGHSHASFGGGGSHENMPPYLTILYIMRAL